MIEKASLPAARMVLPSLRPSDRPQITERRHSDPPALWFAVILGSLAIHLCALGILRLLMMGNFLSLQSGKEIIPVDVIAIAPTKTPTRLPPTTGSTATRNSSSLKPKNPSNLPQNRQSASTSNPSSTRTDSPQASTPKLSPSPNVRRSPAAKPSPNQQPGEPKPSTQPTPSSGSDNQSGSGTSSSGSDNQSGSGTSSSGSNNQSGSGTSSSGSNNQSGSGTSSPNPSPSTTSSSEQPASNPSRGASVSTPEQGSFSAIQAKGALLKVDDPDSGDKLATWLNGSTELSAPELKQLGIDLQEDLELKVKVKILRTGEATVLANSTQVLGGTVRPDKAEQLATKIVSQWRFKPTLMAGKPVEYSYELPLAIRPNQK